MLHRALASRTLRSVPRSSAPSRRAARSTLAIGARSNDPWQNQNHSEPPRRAHWHASGAPSAGSSSAQNVRSAVPPGRLTTPPGGGRGWDGDGEFGSAATTSRDGGGARVYADFGVYKAKAALKIRAVKPTFETDAQNRSIMRRAGGVLFELAAATAPRTYDWNNKATFMLSGVEAAELADRMASNAPCSFFHDPNAGSANRGNVNKGFKVEPMSDGSGGLFVNLTCSSGGGSGSGNKTFHSVPVSYGESAAIRHVLVFCVPRVLGFDEAFK